LCVVLFKPCSMAALRSNIRADVNLVLIPVSISDRWDHPIANMTSNAFRVFEDKSSRPYRASLTRRVPPRSGSFSMRAAA
jgi:hypothetical protein